MSSSGRTCVTSVVMIWLTGAFSTPAPSDCEVPDDVALADDAGRRVSPSVADDHGADAVLVQQGEQVLHGVVAVAR